MFLQNPEFYGFIQLYTSEPVYVSSDLPISEIKSPFIQGSASESHIVLLAADGTCFSMGSNDRGQLGIGSNSNTSAFAQVQSRTPFVSVSCGDGYTIWQSEKGEIYVSGINNYNIPTVLNNFHVLKCSSYQKTAAVITDHKTVLLWEDFNKTDVYKEYNLPHPALDISCGLNFVAVILENQTLFRIYTDGTIEPLLIQPSNKPNLIDRFVKMSSSENCTAAIDFHSNLWIFGQLGRYHPTNISTTLCTDVVNVFTFPNSILAITSNSVLAFGENKDGQLATGGTKPCYEFTINKVLEPIIYAVGNSRMIIYLKAPITRDFAEFDQTKFIPGFSI